MQIITALPKIGDEALRKAMIKELQNGIQLKKATEQAREIQAANEAKQYQGKKSIEGLGRCIGVIPEWEFFRMHQKYGNKEVHSKEFMKYFQKKYPHLSPNKI
jgi:hypothetical protein